MCDKHVKGCRAGMLGCRPHHPLFAETFSSADGWSFEGSEGAAGTIFSIWKRSNGHLLRIGVLNAVEGPYYVADQAQFT